MKKVFLFLAVVCFLSSCVPNKNLIYLQGQPVTQKTIHKINNAPYRLQVDDVISIDIKATNTALIAPFVKEGISNTSQGINQAAGYFSGYSVNKHGNIRMRGFGEINVLGYTTKDVRLIIEKKLNEVIKPGNDFFVEVKLDGIKYTVMGEVGRPGTNVIYQNRVSILEAITNSGDITVLGNRKNVEVIRTTSSGVEKFEIDLTNIDALNSEIFYIKPNDYINVMPLRQKSWGTGTTGLQSLTTFVSIFSLVTSTILIIRGL